MYRLILLIVAAVLAQAVVASAEPARQERTTSEPTKATYTITGLHCPPCTRTVESALKKVKGVRSVKVDWSTKTAKVEFDEGAISAQKLAQTIAKTPHMMGGGMHYGGWLALKVPELSDDAAANKIKEALEKRQGVKRVAVYPAQHAVNVDFDSAGSVTTDELLQALNATGLHASTN
jgi:copper chaperone CopZ